MLSIIIPAYNESEGINDFHKNHLLPNLKFLDKKYEIIYVNDGSKDDTLEILTHIAQKDPLVRIINLSRNFGKEIALTAGINVATGNAILTLDADGQHPPALIKEFVKKWEDGSQVVVGIRKSNHKEGIIKKYGSKTFYKLYDSFSGSYLIPGSTDFRLIDRCVQVEFKNLQEANRITRGLIDWLGFERSYIEFDSPNRLAGQASYSVKDLTILALNSFVSASGKPLYAIITIGLTICSVSALLAIAVFIESVLMKDPLALNITGSGILGIFISFLVGIVIAIQGVTAIYISHIHRQSQGRPLYIINPKGSRHAKSQKSSKD